MGDPLLQKIEEMKEKYDVLDQPTISAWEEKAKQLLLKEGIAGSDAVKYLVDELSSEVTKIDKLLLTATSFMLSDVGRDLLLLKKELYQRVISYFDVKGEREQLEQTIKDSE